MKSIAALLSGGVDSAVALARYIIQNPQHKSRITAFYLKIWLEDETSFLGECPWEEDLYYAQEVSKQLDVPLKIIPLQREYYEKIVSYTLDELKQGATPSPDIFCNQKIKFGAFLEKVDGVDYIISGHYAQTYHDPVKLIRSPDEVKDQTYFLSHLSSEQIKKIILPIGDMKKHQVREFASQYTLAPHQRKDSQGICFLGKIKYSDFVKHHLGTLNGKIIDKETDAILGTHDGAWFYTIGQRSGLGLGGGPWFVIKKSLDENIVWVQHGEKILDARVDTIPISKLHLISRDTILSQSNNLSIDDLLVKIRHGKEIIPARLDYDTAKDTGYVHLSRGEFGIAEGQYTVLYKDQECLGCARIRGSD